MEIEIDSILEEQMHYIDLTITMVILMTIKEVDLELEYIQMEIKSKDDLKMDFQLVYVNICMLKSIK